MGVEELIKTCRDKMTETLQTLDTIPAPNAAALAEKKPL
jgi:hypothetical protein